MTSPEIINVFIQGLSALSTLGAVIVSLWLARRSMKIIAIGQISFYTYYMPVHGTDKARPIEEFLLIEITNDGLKSFILSSFVLFDAQQKKCMEGSPNYLHPLCTKPSHTFVESSMGRYIFDKDSFIQNLMELLQLTSTTNKNTLLQRLKKIKLFATTNLGRQISIKYNQEFLNDCVELILNMDKKTGQTRG